MRKFKTTNQQVQLLIARGVKFSSIKTAKDILSRKNFYNIINGYKNLICTDIKNDVYIKNISFDEIYSLYKLDSDLKNIFLKYVLIAEQEFKTHVSYEFAKLQDETEWDKLSAYDVDTKKQKKGAIKLIKMLNKAISISKKYQYGLL